ncbi:MAG: hypothetical protein P8L34_06625 [Arenicellales bacterium]|nr:hypothetical protein [Arenicellales bacterium]
MAGVSIKNIYKKHLEKVNEHEGVRLFGLMSHGPGVIQINVRAINCVEGMKGLKFGLVVGLQATQPNLWV